MGKANRRKPRLHPESFKQLVDSLYKSNETSRRKKAMVIAELQQVGFCGFAENHFSLIVLPLLELE